MKGPATKEAAGLCGSCSSGCRELWAGPITIACLPHLKPVHLLSQYLLEVTVLEGRVVGITYMYGKAI